MPNPFLLCNTTTTVPSPSAPAHYCVSLCVCVYFRNGTINMFSIYLLFTFRIPDVPLCWCVCFLLRMPTQPRHQIPEPAQPEHRRRTTSSCGTTTSVQVFIYDSRAWSAIFSTGVDSTSEADALCRDALESWKLRLAPDMLLKLWTSKYVLNIFWLSKSTCSAELTKDGHHYLLSKPFLLSFPPKNPPDDVDAASSNSFVTICFRQDGEHSEPPRT